MYTVVMRLPDLLENCYWDRSDLNPNVVNKTIMGNYTQEEMIRVTTLFLDTLGSAHSVPGRVIYTLRGICQWYHDYKEITPKQQVYLIQNLIEHWSAMPLKGRMSLGLV
jgi:hypothetical protein